MSLRAAWVIALLLTPLASLAAGGAVRVQADGAFALPPRIPGAPPAPKPDAETLRARRQAAVAKGIENAVLSYAAQFAREDARDDEAALRAALGKLADYTLGHGVLADLGVREPKPKRQPGDPPPKPRKATDPIPLEHAWRVEAVVDAARVQAALAAAGLALVSGADAGATTQVILEAPYDAQALAALRARISAIGAQSAVPRRFEAAEITLFVTGLPADVLARRLASEPPAGFSAEATVPESAPASVRVRLHPERTGLAPARGPKAP
ncbi:MAG: hypothetical protein FJ091_12205 [Deltaproteobacteria bacterium]|nr:hypothetical protein [Deltaproteobacteria bacterium]